MQWRLKSNVQRYLVTALAFGTASFCAYAADLNPGGSTTGAPVCALIESFDGAVQILDSSRTQIMEPSRKAPVLCGSWISVERGGWIHLKHRDGHRLSFSSGTFAEIPNNNFDGKYSGEHVVLYRGKVYGEAALGSHELKMMTANARAHLGRGTAVLVYDQKQEETQLIALESEAWFENRFAASKRIKVKAGEASSLNFKLLRVIPSAVRAVALASVRSVLSDFHLNARDQEYAIRNTQKRLQRKVASFPIDVPAQAPAVHEDEKVDAAGTDFAAKKPAPNSKTASYYRHIPSEADKDLERYWTSRISGGAKDQGDKILFPKRHSVKAEHQFVVEDPTEAQAKRHPAFAPPAQRAHNRSGKVTPSEKERLIEELNRIEE